MWHGAEHVDEDWQRTTERTERTTYRNRRGRVTIVPNLAMPSTFGDVGRAKYGAESARRFTAIRHFRLCFFSLPLPSFLPLSLLSHYLLSAGLACTNTIRLEGNYVISGVASSCFGTPEILKILDKIM